MKVKELDFLDGKMKIGFDQSEFEVVIPPKYYSKLADITSNGIGVDVALSPHFHPERIIFCIYSWIQFSNQGQEPERVGLNYVFSCSLPKVLEKIKVRADYSIDEWQKIFTGVKRFVELEEKAVAAFRGKNVKFTLGEDGDSFVFCIPEFGIKKEISLVKVEHLFQRKGKRKSF